MALNKTVARLLDEIDSYELTEWMAYFEIEPWGEQRHDWRAGLIAATVANFSGMRTSPLNPSDFIPQFAVQTQTMNEMIHILESLST